MSMTTCGECRFYVSRDGLRGDCRRTSPVLVYGGTCWPIVPSSTRACGEFSPRQRDAGKAQGDLIDHRDFCTRTYNALRRAAIDSWGQLRRLEKDRLLTVPGIGAAAVDEITKALDARRRKRPTRRKTVGSGNAS